MKHTRGLPMLKQIETDQLYRSKTGKFGGYKRKWIEL